MPYAAQAQLANDSDFIARVSSCASVEVPHSHQPLQWAHDHIWWLSAAPGFAEAYEYALLSGNERPGNDPAVITDGMILAAVQPLVAEEYPRES
jgi:hypothetical protein